MHGALEIFVDDRVVVAAHRGDLAARVAKPHALPFPVFGTAADESRAQSVERRRKQEDGDGGRVRIAALELCRALHVDVEQEVATGGECVVYRSPGSAVAVTVN